MIIFDLDGTLADCEHRRHFVDPKKNPDYSNEFSGYQLSGMFGNDTCHKPVYLNKTTGKMFQSDWKSFYEACDKDFPIEPVCRQFRCWLSTPIHIEIWSGRCESVRRQTEDWINYHIFCDGDYPINSFKKLKMRPIADNTPDDQLKEKWLHELIKNDPSTYDTYNTPISFPVDFVFDSDPKSIEMWRRRGVFVFDCRQEY